jgi:hypothetical protein
VTRRTAVIGGFLALLAARLSAAVSTESVTAVTLSTTAGVVSSIALDSFNTIHALYFDGAAQRVKYTTLSNGASAWATPQTVGNGALVHSTAAAMGVDSVRTPHVVYYDRTGSTLKYTRLVSGAWLSLPDIDTFVSTSPFVSLTMGSDGYPRVLYNDEESTSTKVGVYNGTVWSTFTVVSSSLAAPGDLALDSAGRIHALFNAIEVSSHVLVYALQSAAGSSSFSISTISVLGTTSTVAGNVSVALDSGGAAHVTAFDEFNQDLWYFNGTPSTLAASISTVSAQGVVGRDNAIALTSAGLPRITAMDDSVGLDYFSFNGLVWSTTTVDASTAAGPGNSLVLNAYGSPFIAYYTSTTFAFATTASRGLSIAGTVLDAASAGIPGVTLTLTGNIASTTSVTGGAGTYAFASLLEGTYLVTPARSGYGFLPDKRTYVPLSASLAAQDYLGGPVNFSQLDNLIDPTAGQSVSMSYSYLGGHILIEIYTLNGRLVRTLVDEDKTIGTYAASWDGRNAKGDFVASGIYLVRVRAGGLKTVQKVAVVK